jgi:DNA-binding NarL/FixJ family response regulator
MSTETIRRPRVVVAEDDESFRYTVKMIIQADCELVGEAENGAIAIELTDRLRPDLVLLDISMPVMTGLEAARVIRERLPDVRVIIVSSHTNPAFIKEAYELGASGYVQKDAATEQLPQAIEDALNGRVFRVA